MAISAGFPVRLDPWQNIVNVQWPHDIIGVLDFCYSTAGQNASTSLGAEIPASWPAPNVLARVINPIRDLWVGDTHAADAFLGGHADIAFTDPDVGLTSYVFNVDGSGTFLFEKAKYKNKYVTFVEQLTPAVSTIHFVYLFNLSNIKRDFLAARQHDRPSTDSTDVHTDSDRIRFMFETFWSYEDVDGFGVPLTRAALNPFTLHWKVYQGGKWIDNARTGNANDIITNNGRDGAKNLLGTGGPHGTESEENFTINDSRHHDLQLLNKVASVDPDTWHMELVAEGV